MRCSVCGNEFGEGANCQHCGVDRVTGLGNYIGYNIPVKESNKSTQTGESELSKSPKQKNVSEKKTVKMETTMVCYACGEIIPADSRFCPHCGRELYTTCPKCGKKFSSQFPICNQCGTNIQKYLDNLAKQRKRKREQQKKLRDEINQKQISNKEKRELERVEMLKRMGATLLLNYEESNKLKEKDEAPTMKGVGSNLDRHFKEQREVQNPAPTSANRTDEVKKEKTAQGIGTILAFLLGLGIAIYGVIRVMDADYLSILFIISGCGVMYYSIVD